MRQQAYEVLDGLIKSNSSSSGGGEVVDKTPLFNIDLGERPTNIMVKSIEIDVELDKSKLKDEIYINIKEPQTNGELYLIKLNKLKEALIEGMSVYAYNAIDPFYNCVIDLTIANTPEFSQTIATVFYETSELNTIVIRTNESFLDNNVEEVDYDQEAFVDVLRESNINKIILINGHDNTGTKCIFTQFYNYFDLSGSGWSWDSKMELKTRYIDIHLYKRGDGLYFRYSSKSITTS